MHAVGRCQRTVPFPGRQLRKPRVEVLAEHAVDRGRRRQAKPGGQERAFAQVGRIASGIGSQRVQRPNDGFRRRVLTKINLLERQAGPNSKGLLVRGKMGFEFARGRLENIGADVRQKFHLLAQTPTDHRIVAVEAERQRLAVIDFLADEIVDDRAQFVIVRRAPPGRLESGRQLFDALGSDDNRVGEVPGRARTVPCSRGKSGHRSQGNEEAAPEGAAHRCFVTMLFSRCGRVPDR